MADTYQNDDTSTTLGGYVKHKREQAGLSQRQLASQVGMHHSRLARLESGEIGDRLTPEFLQGIADVLDIDVSKLLKFVGVTPRQELPSVRMYFRRKLGVDADQADILANLIADYQQTHPKREEESHDHTNPSTDDHAHH